MSVVRTSSADFETTSMKRLQAFELTAQQDHQVNNFVEPASEAMRRVYTMRLDGGSELHYGNSDTYLLASNA